MFDILKHKNQSEKRARFMLTWLSQHLFCRSLSLNEKYSSAYKASSWPLSFNSLLSPFEPIKRVCKSVVRMWSKNFCCYFSFQCFCVFWKNSHWDFHIFRARFFFIIWIVWRKNSLISSGKLLNVSVSRDCVKKPYQSRVKIKNWKTSFHPGKFSDCVEWLIRRCRKIHRFKLNCEKKKRFCTFWSWLKSVKSLNW